MVRFYFTFFVLCGFRHRFPLYGEIINIISVYHLHIHCGEFQMAYFISHNDMKYTKYILN